MKQKQWVRITVVFFALMIVLTIFSRAAASAAKAKVTVTGASRQTISHEISLDGMVEAKDHFLQYVPSGLMIKSVRVTPGQRVEAGDVLFTVDTGKLQEKISGLEEEIAVVKKRGDLTISRAKQACQDARDEAGEQKALAYSAYTEAENDYNEYMNTHPAAGLAEAADPEEADAAYYDEAVAGELKSAAEAAKSAYETVVREQDKLVEAAEDALRQTTEDLGLEQDAGKLEDSVEELRPYLQNDGQYLSEYTGVIGRIFVEAGTETVAGAAVLLADSAKGVRFTASCPGEYREDITQSSQITLRGENLEGEEESFVVGSAAISKNNSSESGDLDEYSLSADIPGDLYPVGSSVTVIIENQSGEYGTCVPLQCLRQNGNYQYFVYVVEEQDTVLGKELVARALPVTVPDKNEKYAAVEETISGEVIVSANKDITDGSRVKIIE